MTFGLMAGECRPGPGGGNGWGSVLAQARRAEAAGFDSVWLPDHSMWDGTTGRPAGTPVRVTQGGSGATIRRPSSGRARRS